MSSEHGDSQCAPGRPEIRDEPSLSAHAVITAKVIFLRLFAVLISMGAVALAVAIWTVEIHPSSDRADSLERSSPIVRK